MRVCCGIAVFVVALLTLAGPASAEAQQPRAAVATLHISGQHDRAEVTVDGNFDVPSYSIDALDDGKQVVLQVENAVLPEDGVKVDGSAALILRSTASTAAKGGRIVLNLTRPASYRARGENGKIRVLFDALEKNDAPRSAEAPA